MKRTLQACCAAVLAAYAAAPASAHILWGAEHEARAKALAAAVSPAETASQLTSTPIKSADATLTIWGHGGQSEFAGMTSDQMVTFVKAWKKMNPTLRTVEIVICDARHAQDDTYEAFADRVLKGLAGTAIAVKALPKGQSGDGYSILWADGKNGFCYMTATNKTRFDEVNTQIKNTYASETAKDSALTLSNVCNTISAGKSKEGPKGLQYSLIFSQLRTLRANLVVVR